MNEKNDDGGPAYPHPQGWRRDAPASVGDGMTLWDFYAAHALAGALMHGYRDATGGEDFIEARASWAACHADAMLAERRKRFGDGQ